MTSENITLTSSVTKMYKFLIGYSISITKKFNLKPGINPNLCQR